MPASRIRHGVTKSGSPTPSDMTSFIWAAMSKNRRMPDGGQAATTVLSGFIRGSSWGDREPVVVLGIGEGVAVPLVRLEHEVGRRGVHPVDRRQLLGNELGDVVQAAAGDRAAQVLAARDE